MPVDFLKVLQDGQLSLMRRAVAIGSIENTLLAIFLERVKGIEAGSLPLD